MIRFALLARMESKPGKEAEVEKLLLKALTLAEAETGTINWFAVRFGPSTFGIFDTFESETERDSHLSGKIAAALNKRASELFSKPPLIEKMDVLASTVPDPERVFSAL